MSSDLWELPKSSTYDCMVISPRHVITFVNRAASLVSILFTDESDKANLFDSVLITCQVSDPRYLQLAHSTLQKRSLCSTRLATFLSLFPAANGWTQGASAWIVYVHLQSPRCSKSLRLLVMHLRLLVVVQAVVHIFYMTQSLGMPS